MQQIIFPSIVAKNQKELDLEIKKLIGVAKILHLDVVHKNFAPNHSLDFNFKLSSKFKYVAHLMIKNPEKWIKEHLKKYPPKINLFLPHFEEVESISKYILWMRKEKMKVGFALLPQTNIKKIKPYLQHIDYILILTVHPGFYGSKFLPKPLLKINQIKKINPKIKIIVDGGMCPNTIKKAAKAGADYFVSGSFITQADEPKKAIKVLSKRATT